MFLYLIYNIGLLPVLLLLFHLLLQSLQTGSHARCLLGVVLVLGTVLFQLGKKFLVVGGLAQEPHDEDAGQAREEVVVAKAA